MEKSDDDRAIICSIIHIAKKLELQVVIEGIESPQQEQFLIGEGCDIGQGFLYGKPMPCNEFEQSCLISVKLVANTPILHKLSFTLFAVVSIIAARF